MLTGAPEVATRPPWGRRRFLLLVAIVQLALVSWLGGSAGVARAAGAEFVVIINPANPATSASREFLTEAFLKRTTRWEDGETIRPVDLRSDSATRRHFSESILRRSVAAVRSYWQQRIFSGRDVPPPELDSDEAVVSYVLKHRGAIGYVGAGTKLNSAKVLSIR